MKKIILMLFLTSIIFSCSNDENENISAPDDLHPTEWENIVGGLVYNIYFSVDNKVYFAHPVDINIEGTFSYNKPNVELHFTGQCSNNGFVFSSFNVSGSINGDTLTISDNGEDFEFYRKY